MFHLSLITHHPTRRVNPWPFIKASGAHLGADWSYQTTAQAIHKQTCWKHRARHVAIIAGSHAVAALTSDGVPTLRRAEYVAINALTHYAIDSVQLPKWLDQALHLVIALATARLLTRKAAQR
ncbi:MAG TPA: DUF3307 domain-containing protein [Marinagarivorans sp.]|nr:DUF3307 domain-containing protein [Marinagarivorans sp.]